MAPTQPGVDAAERFVRSVQPDYVSWDDWKRIQEKEDEKGQGEGRPRVKFTRVQEMLDTLGRT